MQTDRRWRDANAGVGERQLAACLGQAHCLIGCRNRANRLLVTMLVQSVTVRSLLVSVTLVVSLD